MPPDPESNLSSLAATYAEKEPGYFEYTREEMLEFLPAGAKRVLDVGCGGGTFGQYLKKHRACEVWGVEPDPKSAGKAVGRIDRVIQGLFNEDSPLPQGYFDCIYFNDVLEHMIDPAAAVRFAGKLLSSTGSIVASIPNVGHFPTIFRLIVRGTWEYTSRGILDKTHLRFFTRKSIIDLFQRENFTVTSIQGLNPFFLMEPRDARSWRVYRLISFWPIASVKDMRYLQFVAVARLSK